MKIIIRDETRNEEILYESEIYEKLFTNLESIILDKGIKSAIINYSYHSETIKFSDIKEIKFEWDNTEWNDFKNIIFVKRNGKWYSRNWLKESAGINQFPKEIGITISKIIGCNFYYKEKNKKLSLLYEASSGKR